MTVFSQKKQTSVSYTWLLSDIFAGLFNALFFSNHIIHNKHFWNVIISRSVTKAYYQLLVLVFRDSFVLKLKASFNVTQVADFGTFWQRQLVKSPTHTHTLLWYK